MSNCLNLNLLKRKKKHQKCNQEIWTWWYLAEEWKVVNVAPNFNTVVSWWKSITHKSFLGTPVLVPLWMWRGYMYIYTYWGWQKAVDKVELGMTRVYLCSREPEGSSNCRVPTICKYLAQEVPKREIIGGWERIRGNITLCSSCSWTFPRYSFWPVLETRQKANVGWMSLDQRGCGAGRGRNPQPGSSSFCSRQTGRDHLGSLDRLETGRSVTAERFLAVLLQSFLKEITLLWCKMKALSGISNCLKKGEKIQKQWLFFTTERLSSRIP